MKKLRLKKIRIGEISGVDRPAQVGARVTIMKRDLTKCGMDEFDNPAMLSDVKGHSHLIDLNGPAGTSTYSQMPGEDFAHAHPWITSTSGTITVGAANGHSHDVVMLKLALNTPANSGGEKEVLKMTPEEKLALETQIAKLNSDLALAKSIGELNDAQRAHYAGLDEAGKTEFLKASSAERNTAIEKAAGSNPVVYTNLDGMEFRKNDDPRLVGMAKSNDADRRARLDLESKLEKQTFEKRANDELPNVPGTADTKVALLKAVEGIKDSVARAGALAILKAGNDALSDAFKKAGSKNAPATANDPDAELDRLAKAHVAANPTVDYFTAYEIVSSARPDLFQKAVGSTQES